MTIVGTGLGKKFGSNWIFRNFDVEISPGESVAIIGTNGSGKSTLLQILVGALSPSAGMVSYYSEETLVDTEAFVQEVNFSSLYSEIIEELSLDEVLSFHRNFRRSELTNIEIATALNLSESLEKKVAQFSSGMKQRVKLALQLFYDGKVLALDEPTTNLDEQGKEWYLSEVKKYKGIRTILIASNDRLEYDFCEKIIDLNKV